MPIDDFLQDEEASQYVELYELQVGQTFYYFTSYYEDFVFAGNTYKKAPISIQAIKSDDKVAPVPLKIDIDFEEPFNNFISVIPTEKITLKITIALISDPDENEVIYQGRVLSESVTSDKKVTVALESHTDAFRTKIPNKIHSPLCNNILFDDVCALLESNFTVEATLTGVTSNGIVLASPSFALQPDDYYFMGKCKTNYGDGRLIIDHVADEITVHFPFDARISVLSKVLVTPGCDRLRATCIAKYSNVANYVGMPNIPVRNIAVWGLEKKDRKAL